MSGVLLAETKGFPGGSDGKESACNVKDPGSIPGSGRFPWTRKWQPTPVFLPGKIPWTEEPGELQSMRLQRVRHNWTTHTHSREEGMGMRWTKDIQGQGKTQRQSLRKS